MVAVQFSCPHCRGMFQVDSGMAGQQVACPHCRGLLVVPAAGGYPGPAPVPPLLQSPSQVQPVQPTPVQPTPVQPTASASRSSGESGRPGPLPMSPKAPARVSAPAASSMAPASVADGPIRLREPVKTVARGDDEVELRRLTPEERARRKMIKNVVLWGLGFVIIAITLVALLFRG